MRDGNSQTGWWLAPLIAIILITIYILPEIFRDTRHSLSFRAQSDERSLATAIESYYIDNHAYPAWSSGDTGANAFLPAGAPGCDVPTFRIRTSGSDRFYTLTTPVSYLASYFPDPLAPTRGMSFAYWSTNNPPSWIVWSPGPDGVYQIDPANDYGSAATTISAALIAKTFDPTNGTNSGGDIYRVRWP